MVLVNVLTFLEELKPSRMVGSLTRGHEARRPGYRAHSQSFVARSVSNHELLYLYLEILMIKRENKSEMEGAPVVSERFPLYESWDW